MLPRPGGRCSTAGASTAGSTSGRGGSWSRTGSSAPRGGWACSGTRARSWATASSASCTRLGTERSNSGVYVRIADKPSDPWYAVHHGFEVQIADGGRPERGTGSIYTFAKANARPGKPLEWNTLEITLKGNRVSTAINGVPVADFDAGELKPLAREVTGEGDPARGPRPEAGYIGLQNHDKDSTVFFKEVSVRPLPAGSK